MEKVKTWARTALVVCVVAGLLSCSLDLDPAPKDREATLSFTIAALLPPVASGTGSAPGIQNGRIVSPGTGYIYLRTLGGPVSSSGPLYGPYTITEGATFKTSAIPAGSYDGIGVLYATETLEGLSASVNGTTYTFTELMRLPDSTFIPLTDGVGEEISVMDKMLDGFASGELIKNVTIAAGKVTSLSVVLTPMAGGSRVDLSSGTAIAVAGKPTGLTRRYIAVEGLSLPSGASSAPVTWTVMPPKTGSLTLGRMILFDENGTVLKDVPASGAVTKALSWEASYGQVKRLYLYAEYEGSFLPVSFDAYSGPALTVLVDKGSTYNGKKVLLGVYPASAVEWDPDEAEYFPIGAPAGTAVFTLDINGKGQSAIYSIGSTSKLVVSPGVWYVSGFIDVNTNYASLPDGAVVTEIDGIMPHAGDISSEKRLLPVTVGTSPVSFDISAHLTHVSTDVIYFVANSGRGNALGQTIENAIAFNEILDDLDQEVSESMYVYLVEDINLNSSYASSGISITRWGTVMLNSVGSTPYSLRLDHGDKIISVSSNTMLYLTNVIIDGNNVSRTQPLIDLYGEMVIAEGTTIRGGNNNDTVTGAGGVTVQFNGALVQLGGYIRDSAGYYGGAVFVNGVSGYTPSFSMTGGEIISCTAQEGGGVTINAYGTMYLAGGTIRNCSDQNQAGGVFASTEAQIVLESGLITSCSTTSGSAGGLYYVQSFLTLVLPATLDGIVNGNIGAQWYESPYP
ncbi:MAG: hypothetical protein JW875_02550 [Spirochaetales bacterium]|nr:hypothetical protein [Spirochaetales bacterium]